MSKESTGPAVILDWLASLKLTLFIFFALAAASVVGTLLPQGISHAELQNSFGPRLASVVHFLGLNNLYHSSWFRMLLLLLCANLLVCTVKRLPKTVRLIQKEEDPFDSRKLSKFQNSASIETSMPLDEVRPNLEKAVAEDFGPLRELPWPGGGYRAVGEKGRWSRLMVYGVHFSVLIVLLGALAGSLLGFKGFMTLPEGSASTEVILADGKALTPPLPFQVRCDKFDVSFYDTGAPKDFRSDLSVIEGGREVLKASVRVNDPLTYRGITFYQASYGSNLKSAEIELKDRDSGQTVAVSLPFRRTGLIPGTGDRIQVAEYQDNFMRAGPALGIVIAKGEESSFGSWILVDRPDFHGNRIQNYQVRVLKTELSRYTGLQVKQDPGVWLVWAGFSLMIIGIGLTFYSSHNKVWVCAESGGKNTRVTIAGRTSRNGPAFADRFEGLCRSLENRLNPEKAQEGHNTK